MPNANTPLELEAILGAVVELGERLGVPVPHSRSVYACTKLLEKVSGAARASALDRSAVSEAIPVGGRSGR